VRHAARSTSGAAAFPAARRISVLVVDDGVGFDKRSCWRPASERNIGLYGMIERTELAADACTSAPRGARRGDPRVL
jgi:signal transduction histidine kinase